MTFIASEPLFFYKKYLLMLNKNICLVFSLFVRVALSIVSPTGFLEHHSDGELHARKLTVECAIEVHLART